MQDNPIHARTCWTVLGQQMAQLIHEQKTIEKPFMHCSSVHGQHSLLGVVGQRGWLGSRVQWNLIQ